MLATFLVGTKNTVLGDDTNFAAGGKLAFQWEAWSADSQVQVTPCYKSPAPFKGPAGNVDRKIGFRIGQSLASVAAVAAFLKTIDALLNQTGTLTLQPDASQAGTMVYAGATLKSASLVPSGDATTGKRVTLSYKFEVLTVT